ncbi:MAG: hypothetical protein PQJ59_01700 [Spirochaetales bacterium]|nr:hypothetical protein [Spirochaetales bacterium]
MKRTLLTMDIIRNLRAVRGMCPVCGGPLKLNIRTGKPGQWAHFIRDTKSHKKRFGSAIVGSKYNGIRVCDLDCNNAVQLSYCSRPLLCNELAEDIRTLEKRDRDVQKGFREVKREACCG